MKRKLNCDGEWFNQYEENQQLHISFGQTQKCGRVKPGNGIPTLLLKKNWIFFGNTDINKQEKFYTDFLPLLIYYHKNELNISMDSKIAAFVNAPSLFITS
jgi:hypothetical protein